MKFKQDPTFCIFAPDLSFCVSDCVAILRSERIEILIGCWRVEAYSFPMHHGDVPILETDWIGHIIGVFANGNPKL